MNWTRNFSMMSTQPLPIGTSPSTGLPGLLDDQTRELIDVIIFCGLLPVVFLMGLAGNVMSLVVLLVQGTTETTNVILIGLTITDLVYVIVWYVPRLGCILEHFHPLFVVNMEAFGTAFIHFSLSYLLGRVSACFVCLVALERYLAVLHPFKAARIMSRSRVLAACVMIYVFVFVLGAFQFMIFDIDSVYHPAFNTTVLAVVYTSFMEENPEFIEYYTDVVTWFLYRVVPLFFVLFCTRSILVALRKRYSDLMKMRPGKEENDKRLEQQKITKMLICVCIVFIVCTFPGTVYHLAFRLVPDYGFSLLGRYKNMANIMASLVYLFELTNSSINFILYMATSKKFSMTYRRIFLCGWRVKKGEITSSIRQNTENVGLSSISESQMD
ncbi:hypothetical protein BaRGS_00008005 [Batillaria attramentaria]|uniref:G-protein coupled receptors family 1 profile domain-containing protein n=1 Tax=Batillaria attramentaria TaxID=370345 RepID=A0ABD0LNA5_9CAEN